MSELLSGIGWMFGFIGLGLLLCMPQALDTLLDIFGKDRP